MLFIDSKENLNQKIKDYSDTNQELVEVLSNYFNNPSLEDDIKTINSTIDYIKTNLSKNQSLILNIELHKTLLDKLKLMESILG